MTPVREIHLPPRLRAGDVVALAAPGGAVEVERVSAAVQLLQSRGLRVLHRHDIAERCRYLAGDDARRAAELSWALQHPEVRAVFLARGGYGSQRILPLLDAGALRAPRAVVGFSDNTALLNWLRQETGWCVVHGPHPRADSAGELDAVLGCLGLFGEPARTAILGLELLNPGSWQPVTAEVAGGCLSLLASAAGTPFQFRGEGRIVFLEDVAEPVYRIDRMLQQLRASAALDGAVAVLFGRPQSFLARDESPQQLAELLREFAATQPCPVLTGAACGHVAPNLPLPFGPRAVIDPQRGSLTYLDDAVQ